MKNNEFFINQQNGVLIVVEGISGSGKSVGIRDLMHDLQLAGIEIVSYEWNAIPIMRRWTERFDRLGLLNANLFSMLQWIGFLYDYFTNIRPLLKKQYVIVADRYYYTGLTRDAANGAWRWPGRLLCRLFRMPDWLFYCETEAAICHQRIVQRGKPLFHKNKKILRDSSERNKDLMYLELMHSEYAKLMMNISERTVNVVTMGKLPPSLTDSLIQYIHVKQGKPYVLQTDVDVSRKGDDHELAEASRQVDEDNYHSDRHVRGGAQNIKSMVD